MSLYLATIRKLTVLGFVLAGMFQPLLGQSVEETLSSLPEDPMKEFIQPLANAAGANLNTGWINLAPADKLKGFDLRFGLVGAGAFINPEDEVFQILDIIFPFSVESATTLAKNGIPNFDNLTQPEKDAIIDAIVNANIRADVNGPTVFGSDNETVTVLTQETTITANNTTYTLPAREVPLEGVNGILNDPGIFPTVVPQLSVGTLYGTQATIRWLPNITLDDEVGELAYFGFGIQHNPAAWLNTELPVDFSLSFFTQSLEIGSGVLDVKTTAFGINASKTFGSFVASVTPYAGFLIEKSTMDINYEYELEPGITFPIDVEVEGENKSRLVLGLGFNVVGLNIFADYNFSNTDTFNATLMYGF